MSIRSQADDLGAYGELPANFRIDVGLLEGETVITLHGELDLWSQPQFVRVLRDIGDAVPRLVLDFSDLTLIDAGNIGIIHRLRLEAEMRGAEVVLRSPNAHLTRIMELTGLTTDGQESRPIMIPLPSRSYDRTGAVSDDARRLVGPVAVAQ